MRTFLPSFWVAFPLLGLVAAPLLAAKPKTASEYIVFFGTYTPKKSKGIYAYRFTPANGQLTPIGLAAEAENPSFLAIHPNNRFLYSVGELNRGGGTVTAYAIDAKGGKLTRLNQVKSGGGGPCHLVVDATGKSLTVVNYGTGSTAIFPVKEDGSLGEAATVIQHKGGSSDPRRQKGPHAHSVNLSPDNRFAIVADLGLDEVIVYRLDPAKPSIAPNDPPFVKVKAGSGPRHFHFHPDGKYGYVINEMGSTVTAFSWDAARGALAEIQTISTVPADFKGTNYCAEIRVHPSGKFVYGSNRGHDSIAVFQIAKNGTLTAVEQTSTEGKTPRNFVIDPTGKWLIAENQDSDSVVVFKIDQKTGRLTPSGTKIELGAPVCARFVPAQ